MDVLVVDDRKDNVLDALNAGKKVFELDEEMWKSTDSELGFSAGIPGRNFELVGVTTTMAARNWLSYPGDIVVCDVQMPCVRDNDGEPMTSADTPGGVSVALEALAKKIPVVFCSDGYHHGEKLEWIHRSYGYLQEMAGVPVKFVTGTTEDGKKNWKQAFEHVKEIASELE